jgi:hypothetical protein
LQFCSASARCYAAGLNLKGGQLSWEWSGERGFSAGAPHLALILLDVLALLLHREPHVLSPRETIPFCQSWILSFLSPGTCLCSVGEAEVLPTTLQTLLHSSAQPHMKTCGQARNRVLHPGLERQQQQPRNQPIVPRSTTCTKRTTSNCAIAHLPHEERVSRLEGDELVQVEQDVEQGSRQVPVLLQIPQRKAPLRTANAQAQVSLACATSQDRRACTSKRVCRGAAQQTANLDSARHPSPGSDGV